MDGFRDIDRDDALEAAAARYAPADSVVAWSARADIEGGDYEEAQVAFLSRERQTLSICRAWRSGDAPVSVSRDAEFGADVLTGRIGRDEADELGFYRIGPDAGEIPSAFAREADGDALVLWENQTEGVASYIARVTNAFGEDRLVGAVVPMLGGTLRADIGMEVPVEELFEEPSPAFRR